MSEEISFDDWKKLNLRVGLILSAERVPKTEKLYKLQVNIGKDEPIQIVSSLVPYYTEEQLVGKRIIVLANLKPTKFGGQLSQGMLICAETEDESRCLLLTPDGEIEPGCQIT